MSIATDTFIALRFIEVNGWYHGSKVVCNRQIDVLTTFPQQTLVMHRRSTVSLVLLLVLLSVPGRAQNMLGGLPIDGIRCDHGEGAALHIHANLQMYDRGRKKTVPSNIGIQLVSGCLYWVHTHSNNGMIHIESPVKQGFTLGQFFDIWQTNLSRTRAAGLSAARGQSLRFLVNGRVWTRDPKLIPLQNHGAIVIESGPPFGVPAKPDWRLL